MNALISVIVPVYKVEDYLKDCVESLQAQTFKAIEIILIDDGSPDGCVNLCDDFAKKDARIRVIHKDNGGQSDARNVGLSAAQGEYIVFLDGDDYALPNMCETLYRRITDTGADIAACGFYEEKNGRRCLWRKDGNEYRLTGTQALSEVLKGEKISGFIWGKIFKKDLFNGVSFPVGRIYEDLSIAPDLYLKAKTVTACAEPVCVYRYRKQSATREGYNPKSYDAVVAGKKALKKVKKNAPECLAEARFRLNWCYFMVLDRMLLDKDPKSLPEYEEVTGYLKSHWKEIAGCPYFQRSRRIAAAALKAGIPFYKVLLRMHT